MGGIDNRSKNKRWTLCCVLKCNHFGGHKFPSEATAKNAWIKRLDVSRKNANSKFHAVGPWSSLLHAAKVQFSEIVPNEPSLPGQFVWVRMSPISIRICVQYLVAVRRSCREKMTAGMNGYRITSMTEAPPSGSSYQGTLITGHLRLSSMR